MAASDKWYFTKEQLESTPSRKCGYDTLKELSYRQQAANFIQDMGQRLKVSQLCINTAIVYMHRFYVFHSFTNFPWHQMASAALFLAAKVEEQPRKLEYVIRVANVCRNPKDPSVDITSDKYLVQSQDLVFNENVLLQTLGFDVAIDHPHTHVVRCCQLVRASKDLAQTSYFMASNSLHLTTMCLQYKPTVVACFCIHLACKWSNWEIPLSNEKKEWFSYVDSSVTAELLQQLTEEFLVIFESCPSRLKEKIMAIGLNIPHSTTAFINSPFDQDPKKIIREDSKDNHIHRSQHEGKSSNEDPHKHRSYRPHDPNSQQQREREYREKKERERLAQQHTSKQMPSTNQKPTPHGHHRPPIDPKHKFHSRPPTTSNYPPQIPVRVEPRDILREATRDSPFGIAANRDSLGKETVRDPQVRSDKDKRDHLLKSNVTDTNNLKKYADGRPSYSADKHRVDPSRQSRPVDPNKVPSKHDAVRRHDESKPLLKTDTDNIKKHANANVYFNKPTNTTSQKLKSPYRADASKSVPKQPNSQHKLHQRNGSSGTVNNSGSYGNPLIEPDKIKTEVIIKEEIPSPTIIKRPSLFSPEKTPPQSHDVKSPSRSLADISSILPSPCSGMVPLESPGGTGRTRNYSSSSEPELRPVMKKIDQVEGFENLKRESSIGINKLHQTSDIINTSNQDVKMEIKEEVISPIKIEHKQNSVAPSVNGIETNPTLISNLLKETPPVSHLSTVSQITETPQVALEVVKVEPVEREREHHHHKSKKKNKDKHKHKDKDKNREDREKKKKHKDKDREKHKHREKNEVAKEITPSEPTKSLLVIKIQKDKIQSLPEMPGQGLKIKIPKEKIKTDGMGELSQPITQPPTGGLKIKIPKEVINNCNDSVSKKRERDRSFNNDGPPAKVPKTYKESKHNGRHSYNKVHLGEGDLSQSRLAESKYTNKNSSS